MCLVYSYCMACCCCCCCCCCICNCGFFFPEMDLLDEISKNPKQFNVFREDDNGAMALRFNSSAGVIKVPEPQMQQFIMRVESNKEFIIAANIKISRPSSTPQSLFYIVDSRSRMEILGFHIIGSRGSEKIEIEYRTSNDQTNVVSFRGPTKIADGEWHHIFIHVVDHSNRYSNVSLYVDCKLMGPSQKTTSPLTSVFSYEGTRLSRMEMRIGQRGTRREARDKLQVSAAEKSDTYGAGIQVERLAATIYFGMS